MRSNLKNDSLKACTSFTYDLFVKETPGKELVSKIYKQFKKLNTRKQANQKVRKGPEEIFIQIRHTDG